MDCQLICVKLIMSVRVPLFGATTLTEMLDHNIYNAKDCDDKAHHSRQLESRLRLNSKATRRLKKHSKKSTTYFIGLIHILLFNKVN